MNFIGHEDIGNGATGGFLGARIIRVSNVALSYGDHALSAPYHRIVVIAGPFPNPIDGAIVIALLRRWMPTNPAQPCLPRCFSTSTTLRCSKEDDRQNRNSRG